MYLGAAYEYCVPGYALAGVKPFCCKQINIILYWYFCLQKVRLL